MDIRIEDTIRQAAPGLLVVAIEADVTNGETSEELWALLNRAAADIRDITELPDINRRPGIRATRDAYKALGKEPNRYRPSAEALCRRIVKGLGLYRSTALVDLVNLLSLRSGHSIGAFDADSISGEVLTLGAGRDGEPYAAIGRGELNIAGLPVWRDSIGGIGTPTSDNERTKISSDTRRLLMTVNIYGQGDMPDGDFEQLLRRLLAGYASATEISIRKLHIK